MYGKLLKGFRAVPASADKKEKQERRKEKRAAKRERNKDKA